MTLEFQVIQAPMRLGLAEGVEPHQTPFGTLTTANNVCWTKSGLLEKRRGVGALYQKNIIGTSNSITAGARLFARGNELALIGSGHLYSYVPSVGWADHGLVPEVGLTWSTASDTLRGAKSGDIAVVGATVVYAWVSGDPNDQTTGGDVYYKVVSTGGATIVPETKIFSSGLSASRVRIVTNGTHYMVLWTAGADLYYFTDLGSGSPGILRTDVFNTTGAGQYTYNSFDACLNGANFTVAYAVVGGGISLFTYNFATSPTVQASAAVSGVTSSALQAMSIDGSSSAELYLFFFDGGASKFQFCVANSSTLAQILAPVTMGSPTSVIEPTVAVKYNAISGGASLSYSYSSSTSGLADGMLSTAHVTAAGGGFVPLNTAFLKLLTRPFTLGTRDYAFVSNFLTARNMRLGANQQTIFGSDAFLVDITCDSTTTSGTHREVGKLELLSAGKWFPGQVSNVATLSSTQALACTPFGDDNNTLAPVSQGLRAVTLSIGTAVPVDMWGSCPIGAESSIVGGVLAAYDGQAAIPYGFAHAAYLDMTATTVATTGGSVDAGSHIYNTAPERRSGTGLMYRGPTAIAQTVTTTGTTSKVTLGIVPIQLAISGEREDLALYRGVTGSAIPQRLTVEPSFAVVENVAGTAPLTYVDTSADASIASGNYTLASRPPIYTAGGELDDYQPVGCITSALFQRRLWLVDGSGYQVWFSKDRASNSDVAPGFSGDMTLMFDVPITALRSMDEKLIAFAADRLYLVVGDGPTPNGQNGTYEITPIQSDVGCLNPRSVVSTPDGLMFQSARGIYLLDRGLELSWVGRDVKDECPTGTTVTSGVLVAERNEVRYTVTNNGGTNATGVLVYNYVEKQWTTSSYGVSGDVIVDACMWQGAWSYLLSDGTVYVENDGQLRDLDTSLTAHWIPMTIETAWTNAGGPIAFQSVRTFGVQATYVSIHALQIDIGFDNEDSYSQTQVFESTALTTNDEGYEISVGPRRKCHAIRFRLTDLERAAVLEGDDGGAFTLDTIGIEVGMKKGFYTKPAERTG